MRLPPFQALLDDNRDALWRFLVAHVGPHDAADCFQETMLSALRAYPSLRDGSNLRGWLFTIAHRKVIDLVRARGRQAIPTDEPPEVPSDDRQAMAGVEANGDLWPAVRRLPLKQRTAVVARFVADLPYADIAVMSGSSEEAARQNVRAGLANLRKVVTP
ncbi:MAG: RNA polymerase sigma factor [Acidimicrobiales bacterium]